MSKNRWIVRFVLAFAFWCSTVAVCQVSADALRRIARNVATRNNSSAGPEEPSLIFPGIGIESLKIGNARNQVLARFPLKPNIDSEMSLPNCGTEYRWHDLDNPPPTEITIRFRKDRVFQIEIASTHYQTAGGVTVNDDPAFVKSHYDRELRAYLLLGPTPVAQGERPLIFWTDRGAGIAFALAYSPTLMRRYVSSVIIFRAGSDFCPGGLPPTSERWRELAPYSVEAPNASATLRPGSDHAPLSCPTVHSSG